LGSKRWRTCLCWGLFCLVLIGLGFALDASLPPQPRFVLRGSRTEGITTGALSADGTILTTRSYLLGPDGAIGDSLPFKSWDTIRGTERGEFFHGLIWAEGIRGHDDLDATGFATQQLTYSPDRRYCALVHREGLALADLQTGQEWPRAIEWKSAEYAAESIAVCRLLHQVIDTQTLQETIPLKTAIENLCALFGGKLKIVVASDLLDTKADRDTPDILQEEVWLPKVPAKLSGEVALRLLVSQVAKGEATYQIRRGVVEITASKTARENAVGLPVFSPRGSFVTLAEGGKEKGKLHLVACASGGHLETLSVDPETVQPRGWMSPMVDPEPRFVGFTPDEELLFFWANAESKSLFTAWDTRLKKAARTFKSISDVGPMAPDGETLLASNEAGELQLVNLRNGQIRPLPGSKDKPSEWTFSPDGQTLVHQAGDQLVIWDVAKGQPRCRTKVGRFWSVLATPTVVSADSRVVCLTSDWLAPQFKAWNLDTGARLWPALEPDADDLAYDQNGAVIEAFESLGLRNRAESSPKFTPDRRFLCERKPGRINFLDPATGEPHASLVMDGTAKDPAILAFRPDGRLMLSQWDLVERKGWFGEEWLARWWPAPTGRFVVSEVATGQVHLHVNFDERSAQALLSDDGRTLMTSFWCDDVSVVSCWDVPGRPSLWLVIGIPLALAGVAVLGRWWFARKRRVPLPAPNVS
jgi:hypothetical protein